MKQTKIETGQRGGCCTALNLKFLSIEIPLPTFSNLAGSDERTLVGAAFGLSVLQTLLSLEAPRRKPWWYAIP
jgi:hypothetical protein